ncbi:uncharacterized protein [Danio rerio]|uniref:Uncharacterized protein n=1 Tax=Danio rerio TaxID=7955 RepID=A0AC58HQF5_DANRE
MSLVEKKEDIHKQKAASPEPSCVSVKSNTSMPHPPDLSDGAVTSFLKTAAKMSLCEKKEEDIDNLKALEPSCVSIKSDISMPHPPDLSDGAVIFDLK